MKVDNVSCRCCGHNEGSIGHRSIMSVVIREQFSAILLANRFKECRHQNIALRSLFSVSHSLCQHSPVSKQNQRIVAMQIFMDAG